MGICFETLSSAYRLDDGLTMDYSTMIRMWSALDRSLKAFSRRCGGPNPKKPSGRVKAEKTNKTTS
ncbi:MAG TPA: hypothetical protein PKD26_05245 [Pyrinomonadaceae bacterium]|nr:hypothetical protein [Pyrinomonadaceae bacterium]